MIFTEKFKPVWIPAVLSFIFISLFLLFYPPIYSIRDEAVYAATSYILRNGTLDALAAQEPLVVFINMGGKQYPFYPLGTPLLLILFTLVHWQGAFFMGLLCHLGSAWIFRRLCARQGITHPLVFALYLFFPSFVFFSRTLMSDMPSLLIALLAYDAYFSKRPKWHAGIWLGVSLFFRSSNAILAVPFFAGCLYQCFRDRKKESLTSLAFGYLPVLLISLSYNWYVYGSPFRVGYSRAFTGQVSFSIDHIVPGFLYYFSVLNTVYPLMLIIFLFRKKGRPLEGLFTVLMFLTVFSLYFYVQLFSVPAAKYVLGNRYLFPAIPFLIAAYGQWSVEMLEKFPARIKRGIYAVLILGLIASAGVIHYQHRKVLNAQNSYKNFIYTLSREGDVLLYDDAASELLLRAWGKRIYQRFEGPQSVEQVIPYLKEKRRIYLITRQASYLHGGAVSVPPLKDASEFLQNRYALRSIPAPSGFLVWEITGLKQPSHADISDISPRESTQ